MTALTFHSIKMSLANRRDSQGQSNSTRPRTSFLAFAVLCFISSAIPTLHAQNLYTDPAGAFTVMVPANWKIQHAPGNPVISFTNEKYFASSNVAVVHGDAATTPTADKELEMVQTQFPGNCPQAKVQKRGRTTLGGVSGAFLLVNCTSSKGALEVMKFSVASKPGLLVIFDNASPEMNYRAMLPAFHSMEHSFHLLAVAATPQVHPASADSPAPAQSGSAIYHDPRGRYSLTVPDGWTAQPQASSGTLELSSGPSWAMIVTSGGSEPRDVNHQIAQQIQAQFTGFQVLNQGNTQFNGHASYGTNATGMNPKGQRVSVLVLSINAGSGHFLSIISSAPNDQAHTVNATITQIAQSIRFGGE